jgi:hypothetical protein
VKRLLCANLPIALFTVDHADHTQVVLFSRPTVSLPLHSKGQSCLTQLTE